MQIKSFLRWCLLCVVCSGRAVGAQPSPNDDDLPSVELLEFLAEWGEVEQETFDAVVYHGRQDAAQLTRDDTHEQNAQIPHEVVAD